MNYAVCVCVYMHASSFHHSAVSGYLRPHGLWPVLCPLDFSGKYTGVGCHFLLQGIFLIQGLKLCLLHLLHFAGG